MASVELMNSWNYRDASGASIEPPLTEQEVDALTKWAVGPETVIGFETDTGSYRDVARTAFIACEHIRIPGMPDLTAKAVAANKQ